LLHVLNIDKLSTHKGARTIPLSFAPSLSLRALVVSLPLFSVPPQRRLTPRAAVLCFTTSPKEKRKKKRLDLENCRLSQLLLRFDKC
jgi:hypothetical protein